MARVAVAVAEGFDEQEFAVARERLCGAGHELVLMGRREGEAIASAGGALTATVDTAPQDTRAEDFDALLIPGGEAPAALRRNAAMVAFVRTFVATGKPVAAICRGPALLVAADVVAGRTLTSWPEVRCDLQHAGAAWIDATVVLDGNLVTSRRPRDLGYFCDALLARIDDVEHEG